MRFTSLSLRNWRNFQKVRELQLGQRVFLIGPNASGKSNFLDVFRFLRDVASHGLAKAMDARGGVSSVRCLSARRHSDIELKVSMELGDAQWRYELVLTQDNNSRPTVKQERAFRGGETVLNRPDELDLADSERVRYTALEQVAANQKFRPVAEFFRDLRYQNLLPQVIRDPKGFSAFPVSDDPFGRDFLLRVWQTGERTRESRLKKICEVLRIAVPQFTEIRVEQDSSGAPHLVFGFENWRPTAARQLERDLSDGTIRLLGLLWALFEGDGPLLLEEPEISLHPDVVRRLPQMIERVNRLRRQRRQTIISTHSEHLLSDRSIAAEEVLLLRPTVNGTEVQTASETDKNLLKRGLSVAEVLLPKAAPNNVAQLDFIFE